MAGPVVYIGSIDKAVISQLLSYTAQLINDSTINTVRAKCRLAGNNLSSIIIHHTCREIVRSNSLLLAGPIDSSSLCIICKVVYICYHYSYYVNNYLLARVLLIDVKRDATKIKH